MYFLLVCLHTQFNIKKKHPMKYGILGTGMVGAAIATKLVQVGHSVKMGSRSSTHEKGIAWAKVNGAHASFGTFEQAAEFGEIIFNCTKGEFSIDALKDAGEKNLAGKILVDISNPLDFSKGMPPTMLAGYVNTTSLGEEIQKAFPTTMVVKTLNTMNCNLMVDASLIKGETDVFVCGNDASAKSKVIGILTNHFGWKSPIDLGDLSAARGTEMALILWVRLYGAFQSPMFNYKILKG